MRDDDRGRKDRKRCENDLDAANEVSMRIIQKDLRKVHSIYVAEGLNT